MFSIIQAAAIAREWHDRQQDRRFEVRFGFKPQDDDAARVECHQTGQLGHQHCGVCPDHNSPRFQCGCLAKRIA